MILFINEFKNTTENKVNEFIYTRQITHLTDLKCSVCNKRELPITNLESYKLRLGFVQKTLLYPVLYTFI